MGQATPMRVTWVGHSTVLLELDGTRLLTDPLLRTRVAHLRRLRHVDASDVGPLDAVLISHEHYDHLDVASLRKLDSSVTVVAPHGAEPALRRARRDRVTTIGVGEEVDFGGVSVRATPAEHAGGGGFRKGEAVGYMLRGSASVYFAGDTDLFDEMAGLAPVDLALLPVWGWGPGLGSGHLDPARAAEAVALVQAKVVVPIHWGTYYPLLARRGPYLTEPPREFRRAVAETAPEARVEILQLGETLELQLGEAVR
jgi:L-ascorbate metabolism protein UlaG (beta-lactamase superfamily)